MFYIIALLSHRAKTHDCKSEIVRLACLSQEEMYPSELVNTCPMLKSASFEKDSSHLGCFKDQFVFRRPLEFTMKQKKEVLPSRDYAAKNTAVWEGWILSQLSDDTKLFIREKLQSRQEVAGGRRSVDHDD